MSLLGEILVEYRRIDNCKVELERGQRGGYGWTLSVQDESIALAISRIAGADKRMRELFLSETKNEGAQT